MAANYLLGFLASSVLVTIIIVVITAIGYWKLFEKMNEPGWKGFIPIYNTYTLFKDCWITKYFIPWIIATIITGAFSGSDEQGFLANILLIIAGIVTFIITIALNYHVAEAFGHGIGFAIGLTLLPTIFVLIIGLGSSVYLGNPVNRGNYNGYDDYNHYNDY